MRLSFSVVLVCAGLTVAGQSVQASSNEPETIVVTGTRLEDALADLEKCLMAGCPPLEDMQKSLRVAEIMFVQGDYRDARGQLAKAIDRNKAHAGQHGEAVAGLYRANARINQHLGDGELYRRSTQQILTTLKAAYPEDSDKVLGARLEVADMHVRLGNFDLGMRAYESLKQDAQAAGLGTLAAIVDLRTAWAHVLSGKSHRAKAMLDSLAASGNGTEPVIRLAAQVMQVRLARQMGEEAPVEALLAAMKSQAQADGRPVLLWSPPIDLDNRTPAFRRRLDHLPISDELKPAVAVEKKWMDVGFWITPEGQVQEAEILRSSGGEEWHNVVLGSIARRVYAPVEAPPGSPGRYQIERFTLTALLQNITVSRLQRRSPVLRLETLDLTLNDDVSVAGTK